MKGGLNMSKISLKEIISDYIEDMKKISPSYGAKSFADQSEISRTFVWSVLKKNDIRNFSRNIIEGISKTIKMTPEYLKYVLKNDDGREIYNNRKLLLEKANNILQQSSNEEIETYLNLIEKISKL